MRRLVLLPSLACIAATLTGCTVGDEPAAVPAYWYLPRGDYPTAQSTEVSILVLEIGCPSAAGPASDIQPPTVSVSATEVSIDVEARPSGGGRACGSNPLVPLTVVLPEPLGTRTLVDANGGGVGDLIAVAYPDVFVPPLPPQDDPPDA